MALPVSHRSVKLRKVLVKVMKGFVEFGCYCPGGGPRGNLDGQSRPKGSLCPQAPGLLEGFAAVNHRPAQIRESASEGLRWTLQAARDFEAGWWRCFGALQAGF